MTKLEKMRALLAAGTSGPWTWDDAVMEMHGPNVGDRADPIIETDHGCYGPRACDAALIAAAVNDLGAMLDCVEALTKLREANEAGSVTRPDVAWMGCRRALAAWEKS